MHVGALILSPHPHRRTHNKRGPELFAKIRFDGFRTKTGESLPVAPERDSIASAEVSLYRNILKIQREHHLEHLGISF